MKKLFIFITWTLIPLFAFSQTSSGVWNSKTATYTNSTHKITWQLIEDLNWVGRPILSESTLFKVRNDDTHIMVNLIVINNVKNSGDIWDSISEFSNPEFEKIHKGLAKQNGMSYVGSKAIRSQVCGIHAVKTRTDMKKFYPDSEETIHSIEISISFIKRNCMYKCTVTALSVLEEEIGYFDKIATQIFNGFNIN